MVGSTGGGGVTRVEVAGGHGFVLRTRRGPEVVARGQRYDFAITDPFGRSAAGADAGSLVAPMPGTVLAVNVAEGDTVSQGQTLVVVEAMKMELALKAPYDGRVSQIAATVGRQVALGDVLVEVDADA